MTKSMMNLLKMEEFAQFVFSLVLFSQLNYSWWIFPAFLLLKDVSMIGYLLNSKVGAWLYNLVQHKMLAVFVYLFGWSIHDPAWQFTGIILYAHSSMDRMLGYGLKYPDDFKHTHLEWMGKKEFKPVKN